MAMMQIFTCILLLCSAASDVQVPASNPAFRYIGRFEQTSPGARFDRNGCEIQFGVKGTSQVILQVSQRLTAPSTSLKSRHDVSLTNNPTGSQAHHFLIYVDGKALTTPVAGSNCVFCTFDTTGVKNDTTTEYLVIQNITEGAHDIRIMKTSEPEYNDAGPSPNWVTFHGLSLSAGEVIPYSSPRKTRRIEFIGDSITAGFCNLCQTPNIPSGISSESFALAWPSLICDKLDAECSTVAWSGMGLIRNCCGGDIYMPEVWPRTLATNNEDAMDWNSSSWVPDALVVNLGTNDGSAAKTEEFVEAYKRLVNKARGVYGSKLHIFLACGPMSTDYCDSVHSTLDNATAAGIHAHFLDQRNFLNGSFGPSCCGHPSSQVDAAMGASSADFIARTMGWAETLLV